ncbi:MAG TPA: hypothetical protein VKU88_12630 [Acidimicrobiales bacterium]|nr:hypothetical protein [Acidimicrobiales bacterium]
MARAEPRLPRNISHQSGKEGGPGPSSVVNERSILKAVGPLVSGARERMWVTAPWVAAAASDLLFGGLLARLRAGEDLDVRVVYRLKGADDLTISDLDALDRLRAAGCKVRYLLRGTRVGGHGRPGRLPASAVAISPLPASPPPASPPPDDAPPGGAM